jgi:shikimate kinase
VTLDRPVFLVGFMGAGKTAAGRELARRAGLPFADTDDLVVERAGMPIDRIFRELGEGKFREVEWEALRSLGGRGPMVVATGGGLFLGHLQRRFCRRSGDTVWLDVPLEECRRRVGAGEGRPLWQEADPVAWRALFDRRRAAYALAGRRVAGAPGDPSAVAGRILAAIGAC